MSTSTPMTTSECEQVAAFFTVFANSTRMRILCALEDGPKTVTELAERTGASVQNVSQHLRLMRDKGALRTKREGQFVYYSVSDKRIFRAARMMRAALLGELRARAGMGH